MIETEYHLIQSVNDPKSGHFKVFWGLLGLCRPSSQPDLYVDQDLSPHSHLYGCGR